MAREEECTCFSGAVWRRNPDTRPPPEKLNTKSVPREGISKKRQIQQQELAAAATAGVTNHALDTYVHHIALCPEKTKQNGHACCTAAPARTCRLERPKQRACSSNVLLACSRPSPRLVPVRHQPTPAWLCQLPRVPGQPHHRGLFVALACGGCLCSVTRLGTRAWLAFYDHCLRGRLPPL